MLAWFLVVVILLLLIIEIITVLVFGSFILVSLKGEVPFVPTKTEVLPDIKLALDLHDGDYVCDLGCGNGKVINYLAKLYPHCKFVGSDINYAPIWWGKWLSRSLPNLSLKREDLFKTDISSATHVFVYLFPEMVTKLLPKFQAELKPGAKVISLDFAITDYLPSQVIDLTDKKFKLSKKIFIYQF